LWARNQAGRVREPWEKKDIKTCKLNLFGKRHRTGGRAVRGGGGGGGLKENGVTSPSLASYVCPQTSYGWEGILTEKRIKKNEF